MLYIAQVVVGGQLKVLLKSVSHALVKSWKSHLQYNSLRNKVDEQVEQLVLFKSQGQLYL